MDIDYFKKVNDNYGHDIGDQALVEAAETIRNNFREVDVAARWGARNLLFYSPKPA